MIGVTRRRSIWLHIVFALFCGNSAQAASHQEPMIRLQGRVHDAETGEGVANAAVEIDVRRRMTLTDSTGWFSFDGLGPGAISVRVRHPGYELADTTLILSNADLIVAIPLRVHPIPLRSVTARTARGERDDATRARELFRREVRPGVVGMSRHEIEAVPILAEPDALRSLQTLPGVVALNDLSAQLHVRGGGPDQNLFLLNGARVFSPYHMFGMFGAFNTDAIQSVEFFRGALPARFGGALSSVVDLQQRSGRLEDGVQFEGGVSLHALRGMARGSLPWAEGGWMLAGRRTHADFVTRKLFDYDYPYKFYDVQGGVSIEPTPDHHFRASFLASSDRYRMFFGRADDNLRSSWRNRVGSVNWEWTGSETWLLGVTAWGSGYGGELAAGESQDRVSADSLVQLTSTSRARVGGVRLQAIRRGAASSLELGMDIEGGRIALVGSDIPGSYVTGSIEAPYFLPAAYVEVERVFGAFRLVPALRLGYETTGDRFLLEPRIAARYHFTSNLALTLGAGRSHQVISSLRDDRMVLPGASLWFVHPSSAPASATDAVSAEVTAWIGETWSVTLGAYSKRLQDVPRWQPVGSRELRTLSYDDGRSAGAEVSINKRSGRIAGRLAYGLSRTRFTSGSDGLPYYAPWDRRHSFDGSVSFQARDRLSISARAVYGSGMPFLPFVGYIRAPEFYPLAPDRYTEFENMVPFWGTEQMRYPEYLRLDIGARYGFQLWGADIEPHASVLNVLRRPNVLYYRLSPSTLTGDEPPVLAPEITPSILSVLPSLGVDVRF